MGCCISTNSEAPASASKKNVGSDEASSKLKGFSHERQSRAPPPFVEEETVKEVLSETPKPKPMKQDLLEEETKISARKVEAFAKIQEKEIMSQVSEICSVSESVSTMTNVTDKRDNDEEEEQEVSRRQRVISRSPAKPQSRNGLERDRVFNQSPTRISQQSPARRIGKGSVSLVQNQEARRDPGESSGRRSGSPVTTRSSAVMGRSQSARKTNRSPGRVRSGPIDNSDDTNFNSSRKMDGTWASSNYNYNSNNNDNKNKDNCSTNLSLENPLVSLECFIFL